MNYGGGHLSIHVWIRFRLLGASLRVPLTLHWKQISQTISTMHQLTCFSYLVCFSDHRRRDRVQFFVPILLWMPRFHTAWLLHPFEGVVAHFLRLHHW